MSPVVKVDKYSPVFFRNVRVLADDDDDGDTSSRGGGLSSPQIQQIVDHHNQLRAGEGASNMEKMVLQTTCSCRLLQDRYSLSLAAMLRIRPCRERLFDTCNSWPRVGAHKMELRNL